MSSVAAISSATPAASRAPQLAYTTCSAWAETATKQYSVFGSTIYEWRHRVEYCRNGSAVTRWERRFDYLPYAQFVVNVRGLIADSATRAGQWNAISTKQRQIDLCTFKYGCYATLYPWSTIEVYGNGKFWWTGT